MFSFLLRITLCAGLLAHTQSHAASTPTILMVATGVAGLTAGAEAGANYFHHRIWPTLQVMFASYVTYQIYTVNQQIERCAEHIEELRDAFEMNQQSLIDLSNQYLQNQTQEILEQLEAVHINGEALRQQLHNAEKELVRLQGSLDKFTVMAVTTVGAVAVQGGKMGCEWGLGKFNAWRTTAAAQPAAE